VEQASSLPAARMAAPPDRRAGFARRKWAIVAGTGLLLITGAIIAIHYLSLPTLITRHSPLITQEAQPPPLPLPDKPSIIVLPFVNMSKDPDQEYFSDGLTEVLTGDLSKISSLFVIARNSAFTYKGKAVNVQAVSKELGVQYVLEGSVQRADGRVRINAQLVDATTGHHLWAERYDRELKDIFALQDEIGQKIVLALKVKLTPEEQERFKRFPTDNLEAYDVFMRGVAPFYRYTKEANIQARQMFEKAIELDPQYAGAYAWLGWTYFNDWVLQWSPDPQNLERAFELAQRARALDDSLPDVHQLLSWVYLYGKQQPEQALAEAERAIALDPNYADGYMVQAHVLSVVGRPEEASELAEKALRLNPRGPEVAWYLWELGFAYRLAGRVEEAIATLKQALIYNPNYQFPYTDLALSYVWQWVWQLRQDSQTLAQALAAAQKAIALNDSLSWAHSALASVYLWQKQYDQAAAEAERAIALEPNVGAGYATLAEILMAVGKPEEAFRMAEKAVRIDVPNRHWYLPQFGQAYCETGRYAEASATLKQFISRSPNFLHAQLVLAITASEAGRAEEARAAAAEVLRISPKFSLEVHKQRAPIKDPTVLERHLAALRKAGLK
jgi:TolB-like protein/cytochrome c-type biogenesis protein CcmH/NrfG